jgi:hypothetical protein
MTTGCNIASRRDLCGTNIDASHHIFIHCRFACIIWQWFSSILQMQVADNIEDIMRSCNCGWSKQCGEVMTFSFVEIRLVSMIRKLSFSLLLTVYVLMSLYYW